MNAKSMVNFNKNYYLGFIEEDALMIMGAFDNKTEPIVSLKGFYGEIKNMLDTCLIIFS